MSNHMVQHVNAHDVGLDKAIERAMVNAFSNLDDTVQQVVDKALIDVVEQRVRQFTHDILWDQEFRDDIKGYVRAKITAAMNKETD